MRRFRGPKSGSGIGARSSAWIEHQTTNLGVRSSNLFGRAILLNSNHGAGSSAG